MGVDLASEVAIDESGAPTSGNAPAAVDTDQTWSRRRLTRLLRLGLSPWTRFAALTALLLVIPALGLFANPNELLAPFLQGQWTSGPFAPAVFTVVFAGAAALFVPRWLLSIASGGLFSLPVALLVSVLGTVLGAAASFAMGRVLGRDVVGPLLSRSRLRVLDAQFARRGFLATLLCRLLPGLPFAAVNYSVAFTRVGTLPFLTATAVGTLPANGAYVAFGGALVAERQLGVWLALAAAALVVVGTAVSWMARKYFVGGCPRHGSAGVPTEPCQRSLVSPVGAAESAGSER